MKNVSSPVRVLHILNSMNPGGTENVIMNYYRNIDLSTVQFDFLLTDNGFSFFEPEIIGMGGRIYRVPKLRLSNPFPYLFSVNVFLKEHPYYQIVHSHTSSKSFFPLLIAKINSVPIRISHSHSTSSGNGVAGVLLRVLKPFLRLVATDYLACGEAAAQWLYGKSVNSVKIFRNVINAERFSYNPSIRTKMRQELGLSEDTLVIGHVARFNYAKNNAFTVDVFKEVLKKFPNSKLLLIGDGYLRKDIEKLVKESGIQGSVIFTGVVPNVYDYEQAMDCFMLPSFYEGLPLSLIEAQTSGLKCFVSEFVPRESSVTDLVSFLSLKDSFSYWADAILSTYGYSRQSSIDQIRVAGYDAKTSSEVLQQFYLNRLKSSI